MVTMVTGILFIWIHVIYFIIIIHASLFKSR